jgi:hypothetical protein
VSGGDETWRYPDDGSRDVGSTIEQLLAKYGDSSDLAPSAPASSAPASSWNPEAFVWVSGEVERSLNKGKWLEGAGEDVFLAGANRAGPFVANIAAGGVGVKGKVAYGAIYGGREDVLQYSYDPKTNAVATHHEVVGIILVEGGVGNLVVGSYQTGFEPSFGNTGLYVGIRGGHFAAGVGFNFAAVVEFGRELLGPLGPAEGNPWLEYRTPP